MSEATQNPNYQSSAFQAMLPVWDKVDAVYGGTEAMRAAKTYLPQFPMEEDEVYRQRLEVSTLYPAYRDTIDGLTGSIFRKPIQIGDKVPQAVKDDLENIDNAGTHAEVFAQRLFRTGVHHGAAYVLVDMPKMPEVEVLDAGQAAAINFRPFWTLYSGRQLANWPRCVNINGVPVMQQIIFCEEAVILDGFGEECITQYRVWELPVERDMVGYYHRTGKAQWSVWQNEEKDENKEDKFIVVDSGVSPLDDIPAAVFNANPSLTDPTCSDGPVMIDLANLNIKHYQTESDHESNLHLCTPIPFDVNLRTEGENLTGMQQKFPWGAGVWIHTDDNGSVGYAEPKGSGLERREKWIEKVETQMNALGVAMFAEGSQKGGPMTAEEVKLRGGTKASRMTQLARSFQDCFEQALVYTEQWKGLWKGVKDEAEITLGVKETDLVLDAQDLTALSSMVEKGQHSLEYLWSCEARAGLHPDDFDPIVEKQRIEGEAKARAALAPAPVVTNFTQSKPANGQPKMTASV